MSYQFTTIHRIIYTIKAESYLKILDYVLEFLSYLQDNVTLYFQNFELKLARNITDFIYMENYIYGMSTIIIILIGFGKYKYI